MSGGSDPQSGGETSQTTLLEETLPREDHTDIVTLNKLDPRCLRLADYIVTNEGKMRLV